MGATVLAVAVLAYLLRPYGDDISDALRETSPATLLALTALSALALTLRTEMWRVALRASGHTIPRSEIHAANGGTFLVSLVNGYVGPAVKIVLLRRMRGQREPRVPQLVVTDFAAALLEVLVAAVLVLIAAFIVDVPWWVPTVLVVGGAVALVAVLVTHRRWDHKPAVQGLNVVVHSYYRYRLLALLAGVFSAQILRTWMAFDAVGAHASLGEATLIFVLTGVLGVLPTGLAAAPTTAGIAVLGHDGVGLAAAAGVLVTVALFAATILYTAVTAGAYLLCRRRGMEPTALAAVGRRESSSPRPASGP